MSVIWGCYNLSMLYDIINCKHATILNSTVDFRTAKEKSPWKLTCRKYLVLRCPMMFLFSNVKNLGFFTEKGQEFHRLDPCGANHPTRLLLHGAANSAVAKHFFMFFRKPQTSSDSGLSPHGWNERLQGLTCNVFESDIVVPNGPPL